jgi:hypothetical protein
VRRACARAQIAAAIKRVHEGGHLGRDETTRLVSETVLIADVKRRVAQYIATCPACRVRSAQVALRMETYVQTTEPFEMVRSSARSACTRRACV